MTLPEERTPHRKPPHGGKPQGEYLVLAGNGCGLRGVLGGEKSWASYFAQASARRDERRFLNRHRIVQKLDFSDLRPRARAASIHRAGIISTWSSAK